LVVLFDVAGCSALLAAFLSLAQQRCKDMDDALSGNCESCISLKVYVSYGNSLTLFV
jgi:hypothetical protein